MHGCQWSPASSLALCMFSIGRLCLCYSSRRVGLLLILLPPLLGSIEGRRYRNGQARGAFMHTKLRYHVTCMWLYVSGSIELYVTCALPGRLALQVTKFLLPQLSFCLGWSRSIIKSQMFIYSVQYHTAGGSAHTWYIQNKVSYWTTDAMQMQSSSYAWTV